MQRFEIMEINDSCPYCGSAISLLIDLSVEQQSYIEDCEVCCRPISVHFQMNDDVPEISLLQENEML
mgnify:CR=1 FL=1